MDDQEINPTWFEEEPEEMHKCASPKCDNLIIIKRKYCSDKCNDLAYYYRHKEKRLVYQKNYQKKNYRRFFNKRKEYHKNWVGNNREKVNALVLSYYHENKERWNERSYITSHRDKFKEILGNKCANCGKGDTKIISIIDYYNTSRRIKGQSITEYIKKYAENLKPFCDRICSNKYRRKINGKT